MTNREARDLYYSVRYNLTNPKHKEAVDVAFAALERQEEPVPTEEIALEMNDKRAADILSNANLGGVLRSAADHAAERLRGAGWISVKERLPEDLPENEGRKVIPCIVALKSCYPNGKATIQKRQRQATYDYDNNLNGWEWSRIGKSRVTHWMPLPEAPKEEV